MEWKPPFCWINFWGTKLLSSTNQSWHQGYRYLVQGDVSVWFCCLWTWWQWAQRVMELLYKATETVTGCWMRGSLTPNMSRDNQGGKRGRVQGRTVWEIQVHDLHLRLLLCSSHHIMEMTSHRAQWVWGCALNLLCVSYALKSWSWAVHMSF